MIKGFVLAIVLAIIGALVVIYGGFADVSALHPHTVVTGWVLDTAMVRSVKRNALTVTVPNPLPPANAGFADYDDMCVICHGAPGGERSHIAKGLRPDPPDLAKASLDWSDAELFWIIKNGVKMTGMPAWGPTHSDKELWEIVAFVRSLPSVTPQGYAAMKQQRGAEGMHHS